MKIKGIIWLDTVVEKLIKKHNLNPTEVEEVFLGKPIALPPIGIAWRMQNLK